MRMLGWRGLRVVRLIRHVLPPAETADRDQINHCQSLYLTDYSECVGPQEPGPAAREGRAPIAAGSVECLLCRRYSQLRFLPYRVFQSLGGGVGYDGVRYSADQNGGHERTHLTLKKKQPPPPDRELTQAEESAAAGERHSIIGADRQRKP